jgi:hypothetical protein
MWSRMNCRCVVQRLHLGRASSRGMGATSAPRAARPGARSPVVAVVRGETDRPEEAIRTCPCSRRRVQYDLDMRIVTGGDGSWRCDALAMEIVVAWWPGSARGS